MSEQVVKDQKQSDKAHGPRVIFSSALCYCTAELLSWRGRSASIGRPTVVSPSVDIVFSETVKLIDTKFYWQVPIYHISRTCFCFLKFTIFFFVFVNIGPYGNTNFKRHLLWKYASDSIPKNHAYSWGVSTKIAQRIVKFQILDFWQFFFFVLFWAFSMVVNGEW